MMGHASLAALAAVLLTASAITDSRTARAESPVLAAEQSDVVALPTMAPHWLLAQTVPSGMTLYDADKGRILGLVPMNFTGNAAVAPDLRHYYVATTIWSRDDHGTRQDLLQSYDFHTLGLVNESDLPPRALAVFKLQDLDLSASGRFAYVFNLSPASSITVFDLAGGHVRQTVDIPGCALVFPWKDGGFSSLCGDGSLISVALPAGKPPVVSHVKPFFDATHDPVFEASLVDPPTARAIFITYSGKVFEAGLGASPTIAAPWSLQQAAGQPVAGTGVQELAWRPGGDQLAAWHKASHRLFVLMHPGVYWTQKQAGTEVWVFDLQTRRLLRRIVLEKPAKGIAVSQDGAPLLYAANGDGDLAILDATTGKQLRTASFGGFGSLMITPRS